LRERGQPGTVQYAQQAGRHVANVPPGSARRDDAQLTDDVVFEVPLAAPILHVRAPEKVVAGTSFHLEVILDEIPKEVPPECALSIGFRIHPAAQSPVSTADNAPVQPDRHSYKPTGKLDVDVPSGVWKGLVTLDSGPSAQARERQRKCHTLLAL
jgi:hypothetical protein